MPELAVRPAGPAADLALDRAVQLAAEVQRLQIELHRTQLALDDLTDESSPLNGPEMERLTALAVANRLRAPRARHLITTEPGAGKPGALARMTGPLRQHIHTAVAASALLRSGVTA
ncbi:hypothetical protein ACFYTS_35705 [Nocardia sp. NPDC004151]|uniref:hypothetical protein n=1 Tax=Nocardia sp. NPDC004151 TaxID=3364304 RepID=UPI0036B74B08